ncbi:MAG: hypothetical protein IJ981_03225 [Clostridia bacterium]|nr:hypothetical protein [Clostridia bacterium]
MKCKSKEIKVVGIEFNLSENKVYKKPLYCICSNDEQGKSLSVDNGEIQFTIPMDEIAKCFEGDYRK